MVVTKEIYSHKCTIKVNGIHLRQEQKFNYLGARIPSEGSCFTYIESIIGEAKIVFYKLKNTLCNKCLSMEDRNRVPACFIKPILTYNCGS